MTVLLHGTEILCAFSMGINNAIATRTIRVNEHFANKVVAESYLFPEMLIDLCCVSGVVFLGLTECSSEVHMYVVPHLFQTLAVGTLV